MVLLPDAGPLITLADADSLDLLFRPGWTVGLVDMVLHKVTRNQIPTTEKLAPGVFLFEGHKIARASFLVPDNCRKVSTRAFLQFLQQKSWLASASEIERKAIQAGRTFSSLRFPH